MHCDFCFGDPLLKLFKLFKRPLFRRLGPEIHQESAGSEVIRKLPLAEKQQRLEDQQTRLGGLAIVGELEPSHALIDLVNSMLDNDAVMWVPPSKCTKRESEIQIGTKEKSQT